MIFNKLKMHNFKSHKDTVIDFNKGINVIIGQNGAGKSSILEGISFALFKKHTSKKIDYLVKNNEKSMSVELDFSSNNGDFRIIRKKNKNLKSTLLQKEGDNFIEICSGEKEVSEKINDILGVDYNIFFNAIYIRQGEITTLVDKTISEKKALIGSLLGLDSFENVWKNLLPYINEYKNKASEYKGESLLLGDFVNSYKDKITDLHDIQNKLQKFNDEAKKIKNELDELNIKYDELNESKNVFNNLTSTIINIEENIYNYSKQKKELLKQLDDINNKKKELKELEDCPKELERYMNKEKDIILLQELSDRKNKIFNEIQEYKDKKNSFLKECSELLSTNIKSLSDANKIIKNNCDKIKAEKMELSQKNNELKEKIIILNQEQKNYQKNLDSLKGTSNKCPICQSDISEEQKVQLEVKYNEHINKCEENIKTIESDIEKNKEQINVIDNQKSYFADIISKITYMEELEGYMELNQQSQLEEIIEKMNKININNIDETKQKIQSLKNKVDKYNQLLGVIQNEDYYTKQLQDNEDELNRNENILSDSKTKMKSINYNEDEYISIKNQFNDKKNEYDEIKNSIFKYKGQGLEIIDNLYDVIDKINISKDSQIDYKVMNDNIDLLVSLREVYGKDGVQKELRNMFKPLIEKRVKEIFNSFNFNYSDLYLNSDYEIIVCGPEGESSTDMISGGEKIAIALALRFGITQVITKEGLDSIILDEPTIHLDDIRRQELIGLLKNISLIPQMIIVTHENQLESVADNLIEVKKENGISFVL